MAERHRAVYDYYRRIPPIDGSIEEEEVAFQPSIADEERRLTLTSFVVAVGDGQADEADWAGTRLVELRPTLLCATLIMMIVCDLFRSE